jgi:probable rRNA maturation factor
VLSWPAEDLAASEPGGQPLRPEADFTGEIPLGDIAIAYDTCAREAAAAKKPLADHLRHLIVHGVLHLLGYDHISDLDATVMEGLEVEILGNLGLDDPYTVDDSL